MALAIATIKSTTRRSSTAKSPASSGILVFVRRVWMR
jgi:hypothetical protein